MKIIGYSRCPQQLNLKWFFLPFFLLLLTLSGNAWGNKNRNEIEMKIRFYPNTDWREKVAIKSISSAIKKYPKANIYKVRMPGNKVYADGLLTYDRKKKQLIRSDIRPLSGGVTSWWNGVRDASIHKAALKSASFNDMSKYGVKPMF